MMQDYWNSNPKPRKNLEKFVRHMSMSHQGNRYAWEYIFYDRLLDDEMIDFMLKMKVRKEYSMDDLAKLEGKSVEECARIVARCVQTGLLEYWNDPKDTSGVDHVMLHIFAPGAMENFLMDPAVLQDYPECAPAFKNYILDMQKQISNFVPMGNAFMRVIPIESAIQDESRRVKYEEVSYWLDQAGESIAVADCMCRRSRDTTGEGTADLCNEWCIQLGKHAESAIRIGKARRITREEAEDIIKRAEEMGFVHQLSNYDGPDFSLYICNCSWDSCCGLRMSWYTQSPNLSASNYRAHVNPKNCVACGACVEVCPQNAVRLGQKICQKQPIEIKDEEIANDHVIFTSKNWKGESFLTDRKYIVEETGTAPCKSNCPAHIPVQGYVKKAGMGKYDEALELIKKENPFPAVCGSVCARFCEQVCTRGDLDEPVANDEVKKFIAQRELKQEDRYIPKKRYDEGKKIAVIGAGPAGLSCAYYLAVLGHTVTVFEKEPLPGGMMTYGIPNFRLEKDVVNAEIEVLKEMGVEIKCGVTVGKDITLDDLRKEDYKGFYVAIGAQGGRKLGVPGEDESKDVLSGIDFLRAVGNKSNKELPKKVVVIGGGNVAVDVARTALRQGAEDIDMFCLEQRNEMPAADDEIEETEAEGIRVNCGWGPKEILVKNGKVTGIVMKKCTSVKDAQGRFNPQYDEDATITVACSAVLAAIGQSIQWGNLLDGSKVELGRGARAEADKYTYQTAEPDVFVGGDVYTGPRFLIDAVAAGKEGADSLHRYVWDHSLVYSRMKRDTFKYIDKDNLNIGSYNNAKRAVPGVDKAKSGTMSDERMPLTEEQVRSEASRCLECGASRVDQNLCIGCGACTTQCKFDAIHLTRDYNAFGAVYEQIPLAVMEEMGRKSLNAGINIVKTKLKGKEGFKNI